jgi:hypothetical protein
MKFNFFSKAICLTVIPALICSCANTHDSAWRSAPADQAPTGVEVGIQVAGMTCGAVGVLVAAGTIAVIEHSRHAHDSNGVPAGSATTEYLTNKSTTQAASTQPRRLKSAKVSLDSSGKITSASTPPKRVKSAKASAGSSETQYLVQ